jgi:sodium/proline symporter
MIWMGRAVVVLIAFIATALAIGPIRGTVMDIVGHAWGVFGAAFGPSMILALYWKRFNLAGAITGILTGTTVAVLWVAIPMITRNAIEASGTTSGLQDFILEASRLFGIVPAFFLSLFAAIIVTLATKKPSAEVESLFDKSLALQD